MLCQFHGIDREFDIHVALHLAASGRVDEFLRRLGHDGVAVVVQPIDQRSDRRILLILDNRSVVESAHQSATTLEFKKQALVVDIETKSLCCCVEVGTVNKQRDLVRGRRHQFFTRIVVV